MLKVNGWASTERVDRDGDVITSDAFAESLKDYMNAGGVILYNHNKDIIVGKCLLVKVVENKGLWVEAEIFTKDEGILTAIRNGALRSFSVGFLAKNVDTLDDGQGVVYEKGDLLEISIVSVPANPDAVFMIVEDSDDVDVDGSKDVSLQSEEIDAGKQGVGSLGVVLKDVNFTKKEERVMSEKILEEKSLDEIETKNIEEVVMKQIEQEKIEKAVNTLTTSSQFQTVGRAFIFDGIEDGKMFYVPNIQATMVNTLVQVPILGEANVFIGENATINDSNIGENTITLTATQYTARYPISYLLEQAGGSDLVKALESNLKKSIARKFDVKAYETLSTGNSVIFDFGSGVLGLIDVITGNGGNYFGVPSNCAMIVNSLGYSWLMKQTETLTMQNFGNDAVVKTGAIGKFLGMDVYMVPVNENKKQIIVVNKDYIASGQFGDISYVKMVDNAGVTYIIAKALLAFNKANTGGVLVIKEN